MTELGRNEPCRCGSGRKYKKCCLEKDDAEARQAHAVAEAERRKAAAEQEPAEDGSRKEDPKPSEERGAHFGGRSGFQEKTAHAKRSASPVAGWSRSSTGNR